MQAEVAMFAGDAAIPLPKTIRERPQGAPRIAVAHVDAVLVDVTRPVDGTFSVRVYEEGYPPPDADIVAVYVLYGPSVTETADRLEKAWAAEGIKPKSRVRSPSYCGFDLGRPLSIVLRSIETLQRRHLP
jgi:hypothetical protein